MLWQQRVPRPPLDAFVEWIWVWQEEPRPHRLELIMPTGAAQLIINLAEDQTRRYDPERQLRCITSAGTVLSGVQSRYQIIDTLEQQHVAGVSFKPGGTAAFMRIPAHETADLDVPVDELWDRRRAAALRERLLAAASAEEKLDAIELALLEMCVPSARHPAVHFALGVFDRLPHTTSIGEVTDAIGMSGKRFIERFKREVGLTPKRYCRIRRFQRALAAAHDGREIDWAQVALDCGYYDQSHFIHDFRAFAGVTPTAYQAARTPYRNHVKFEQSGGSRP